MAAAVGAATGGTLAWLSDQSSEVINTFTYGDVRISLSESPSPLDDGDDLPTTNSYKMMPGQAIVNDPRATVHQGSEDCYLYVRIDESANFADFMTYEIAEGWTPLTGAVHVYWREVSLADVAQSDVQFAILKDDTVQVRLSVTAAMLRALDAGGTANYPQLYFTAYAVQRDANIPMLSTAENAWAALQAP